MDHDAGLISAGLSGPEPMRGVSLASSIRNSPHGAIKGFEGADVFASWSPMLPIEDSLELLHAAADFDGQAELGVVYAHRGHLVAIGFGLDEGAGFVGTFVSRQGLGNQLEFVGPAEELLATNDRDSLAGPEQFAAGIEEGIAEIDVQQPDMGDSLVAQISKGVGYVYGRLAELGGNGASELDIGSEDLGGANRAGDGHGRLPGA